MLLEHDLPGSSHSLPGQAGPGTMTDTVTVTRAWLGPPSQAASALARRGPAGGPGISETPAV